VIEGWWRCWPEALPGIPLRYTTLVVVDADRRDGVDGVGELSALKMLGPHSKIATPSGGLHMVFAQPDPPITSRFQWCKGVEVIGSSGLLTCYDLEALWFPYVAPRAILPEMFRRPRDRGEPPNKEPRIKSREERDTVVVADLTAALWEMDATDWRGDYDGWFHLAGACQAVGITKAEFVRWSMTDPVYAADQRSIERIWDSAHARHGGAFWKALAERGIKVGHSAAEPSLYPWHPFQRHPNPTRGDWRVRFNGLLDALRAKPDPDMLFWAGCRVAEMMVELRKPKPSVARALLEGACPRLRRELGGGEVERIITNAFHHIEKGELG
jgi:hypothetical protein